MIFVLDNYDSFTYNLVQYIGIMCKEVVVKRNDQITIKEIEGLKPKGIIISPGPKEPSQAGISKQTIEYFTGKIPVLGVCLGHQAIGEVFGGKVIKALTIMHGKISKIKHNQKNLFKGITHPLEATRYHSLIVERSSLPDSLRITAETDDGIIMGLEVKNYPTTMGVQFHPESILTQDGMKIIENFYSFCK